MCKLSVRDAISRPALSVIYNDCKAEVLANDRVARSAFPKMTSEPNTDGGRCVGYQSFRAFAG